MVSQNSINNTSYDNDFNVNRRDAGPSDVSLFVSHLGTPNVNSNAQVNISTPNLGGDPAVRMAIAGIQEYPFGIQHANNNLVIGISPGTPSSTTPAWRMTPAGERTMPLQPIFFAQLPASDLAATGAAAVYTLGATTALTVNQQGTAMATNGTFTAPVTGWYLFEASITMANLAAAMTSSQSQFFFNGATSLNFSSFNIGAARTAGNGYILQGSVRFPMVAGQTMLLLIQVSGGGGNTVDIVGSGGGPTSWFSGTLVC